MGSSKSKIKLDVVVDVEDLIIETGPGAYDYAHGAAKFLAALNKIPGVRITVYSRGRYHLFGFLTDWFLYGSEKSVGFKMKADRFQVLDDRRRLKGLWKGINLDNVVVLVHDFEMRVEDAEEKNLLKLYPRLSDKQRGVVTMADLVYRARVENNLVRALGLIKKALEMSDRSGLAPSEALHRLQWNEGLYLHEESNSGSVYLEGLQAIKKVQPGFVLAVDEYDVLPWEVCETAS